MLFTYNKQKYLLVLFTLAGSRFYGTHFDGPGSVDENGESREHPFDPNYRSDSDWRGVFVAHPDTKIGMTGKIDEIDIKKSPDGKVSSDQKNLIEQFNKEMGLDMPLDEDITLYEVKKFVTMALEANPNIMDIIYADGDAVAYANDRGQKLLNEGKKVFISKKTKFTFSGYAMSQLKRVKGHNKWVVKFPKTGIVLNELNVAFAEGEIDYNWITDHFGGDAAKFSTGMKQQEANKLPKIKSIDWAEFVKFHSGNDENSLTVEEWEQYSKPQLIDYVTAKDLRAQKFPLKTTEPFEISPESISTKSESLEEFLVTEASFRSISNTQYNIFTSPSADYNGGIFARDGNLRKSDPEKVGQFVCQLSIDEMNYKKDLEDIRKLWEWRTKRNEKRSVLEENFGYDTKHCSHLFRLLIGAKNILKTGDYKPRLTGDNLKLVKNVLNGKYTYEWIIEESTKMEKELETLYKTSKLPHTADHKKANELLIALSQKF